jgi:hypothetical protein
MLGFIILIIGFLIIILIVNNKIRVRVKAFILDILNTNIKII